LDGVRAGYARVLNAGRPLLLAAQTSGEAGGYLILEQILDMVAAIAKIPGDISYREPILQRRSTPAGRSRTPVPADTLIDTPRRSCGAALAMNPPRTGVWGINR